MRDSKEPQDQQGQQESQGRKDRQELQAQLGRRDHKALQDREADSIVGIPMATEIRMRTKI